MKSKKRKPTMGRAYSINKICRFCNEKVDSIDYKDIKTLRAMVTERYKIIPRRISGTCAKHQRKVTTAVNRARNIALLPFTA